MQAQVYELSARTYKAELYEEIERDHQQDLYDRDITLLELETENATLQVSIPIQTDCSILNINHVVQSLLAECKCNGSDKLPVKKASSWTPQKRVITQVDTPRKCADECVTPSHKRSRKVHEAGRFTKLEG